MLEVAYFLVHVLDAVGAGRSYVFFIRAGAHMPGFVAVGHAGVGLVGAEAGGHNHRVDEFAAGVVHAYPVVLAGGENEVGVECASVGEAVGKEHHVLATGDASVHVAQGNGVFGGVGGVVGEIHRRDFQRGEVAVEKLDPAVPFAVFVDDACLVLHHHLVDFQCFERLCGCRRSHHGAGCRKGDG